MINLILFFYCFLISLFIVISGILNSHNNQQVFFQMLFLPITSYFFYIFLESILEKKPISEKIPKLKKTTLIISFFLVIILIFPNIKKVKNLSQQKNNQIISPTFSVKKPTIAPTKKNYFIKIKEEFNQDKINVRSQPSLKSNIINKLNPEKSYQLIEEKEQWYKIYLDENKNQVGFVKKDFVEKF